MCRAFRKGLVLSAIFAGLLIACGEDDPNTVGRAYAGAPPTIPHKIEALGRGNCLSCHKLGLHLRFEDSPALTAPATPHPYRSACRQCHVRRNTGKIPFGENLFSGAIYEHRGTRAHPLAPPRIPHRLQNRNNCLACHGNLGRESTPTSPHTERSQCIQCHVRDNNMI